MKFEAVFEREGETQVVDERVGSEIGLQVQASGGSGPGGDAGVRVEFFGT